MAVPQEDAEADRASLGGAPVGMLVEAPVGVPVEACRPRRHRPARVPDVRVDAEGQESLVRP
ncbi:hypothetical protein [Streptomyces sp. NPDC052015]|uniref:hypothetical protein n=1 Tax=Streptomyces sp. NPDC052015 TaxID=3154755 RepID=UPI00341D1170